MRSRVSIIIPAYNAEATIGDCLNSLCRQTDLDADLEIVVVDDGSTDGTVACVQTIQKEHKAGNPAIQLLPQPQNKGPAAARNRGAAAAKGDFLLFTDADCTPHSRWVCEMVSPFACPEVAAVKGAYKTQQRELVARFAQAEFEARYQKLATARFIDVVFSYAAAFRREVFWEVEGFDTWFPVADNEDTELSYRLAAAGRRIVFNPRAIVYHRHPRTLRQYLTKKFSRAYWRAFVYRRFPGKAVRDSYTPQSLKLQIGLIYLLTLTTALTVLTRVGLYLAAATLGVFFVTTLPFLWRLPREERHLQVTAPFFLLCRAVVMAAGLLSVLPRLIKKEEQIDERLR